MLRCNFETLEHLEIDFRSSHPLLNRRSFKLGFVMILHRS